MKIAIIEIGKSHDECIYSQVKIIKSLGGTYLSLIFDQSLEKNEKYFDLVDDKIFMQVRKGIKKWIDLFKIWKFCQRENFDKIILNTAQGKLISKLLRFPFNKHTQFYGILHNVKKVIKKSNSQKIISKKVKHYFILNENLEKRIRNVNFNKSTFSTFHPIFFCRILLETSKQKR